MQHDLAAEVGDRLHLDLGGRERHHDDGPDAPRARGERDALRMVAGGGADHAALRGDRRELRDLVVRSANFERKHRLKVFPLEEHPVVQTAGERVRRVERSFDRDVVNFGFEDSFEVVVLHVGPLGSDAVH